MTPFLQASTSVSAAAGWEHIAGPAGGFVALVVLLVLAGRGAYRLGARAIEAAQSFGSGVIAEWRRSNDEMRSWLQQHAAEETAVLREIRDSLRRHEVERARAIAEIKLTIEASAKDTRHDIRDQIQVLAARLEDVPGYNDSEPPPSEHEREAGHARRERERSHEREKAR